MRWLAPSNTSVHLRSMVHDSLLNWTTSLDQHVTPPGSTRDTSPSLTIPEPDEIGASTASRNSNRSIGFVFPSQRRGSRPAERIAATPFLSDSHDGKFVGVCRVSCVMYNTMCYCVQILCTNTVYISFQYCIQFIMLWCQTTINSFNVEIWTLIIMAVFLKFEFLSQRWRRGSVKLSLFECKASYL